MHFENLPIVLILMISVIGNNHTVAIAALVLLLLKLLGLASWIDFVEMKGITIGVTILTAAVLVPLATGRISADDLVRVFKTPTGLVAVSVGLAVAWIAGQGLPFMKASPEMVTALMVGTLMGVCFLKGLAVGPLIAAGMVALIVGTLKL